MVPRPPRRDAADRDAGRPLPAASGEQAWCRRPSRWRRAPAGPARRPPKSRRRRRCRRRRPRGQHHPEAADTRRAQPFRQHDRGLVTRRTTDRQQHAGDIARGEHVDQLAEVGRVGGDDVAQPGGPPHQPIERRRAHDHLTRGERIAVPDATVLARQPQLRRSAPVPTSPAHPVPVELCDGAGVVEDGDGDAAPEVLVTGGPQDAERFEPAPQHLSFAAVLLWEPVAQRPVREPQPELVQRRRVADPSRRQPPQRVGRALERVAIEGHHLGEQLGVVSPSIDRRREPADTAMPRRPTVAGRGDARTQQLNRVTLGDPLRRHHPLHRPTRPTRPRTPPLVPGGVDGQRLVVVGVERAAAHQPLTLGPQRDTAGLGQPHHRHLDGEPVDLGLDRSAHGTSSRKISLVPRGILDVFPIAHSWPGRAH